MNLVLIHKLERYVSGLLINNSLTDVYNIIFVVIESQGDCTTVSNMGTDSYRILIPTATRNCH